MKRSDTYNGNKGTTEDKERQYREDVDTFKQYAIDKVSRYDPDSERGWANLQEAMKRKGLRSRLRIVIPAAAVIGLLIVLSVSLHIGMTSQESMVFSHAGKGPVTLEDGSVIWLNNNSVLSYEEGFGTLHRNVSLEGEALFDVVRGEMPFRVNAGEMDINVHGTLFNVRSYLNDDSPSVTLIRGSVSLSAVRETRMLQPGQSAYPDREAGKIVLTRADTELETIWARDYLRFEDRSLADICLYLEKWYNIKINIPGNFPAGYRYTFSLFDEPLSEVLDLMSRVNAFSYTLDGNSVTIDL